MFSLFKKKPAPVDPVTRLKQAVDEVNAALSNMPYEYRKVRPFMTAYNAFDRKKGILVSGYWENMQFNIIYDGIQDDLK